MQQVYVKQQDNSAYLLPANEGISFTAKDGYIQVYPSDNQWTKLINFTDKCYLTADNLLVVPDQVPMSQTEQNQQNLQNTINQLKKDRDQLQTDRQNKDQQISDLNTRIGQLMVSMAHQPAQGGNK